MDDEVKDVNNDEDRPTNSQNPEDICNDDQSFMNNHNVADSDLVVNSDNLARRMTIYDDHDNRYDVMDDCTPEMDDRLDENDNRHAYMAVRYSKEHPTQIKKKRKCKL